MGILRIKAAIIRFIQANALVAFGAEICGIIFAIQHLKEWWAITLVAVVSTPLMLCYALYLVFWLQGSSPDRILGRGNEEG